MRRRLPVNPDDYALHYTPRTPWCRLFWGWFRQMLKKAVA